MSASCPLCGAAGGSRHTGRGGLQLLACPGCGTRRLDTAAHPYDPKAIYDAAYFAPWDMRPGSPTWTLRADTARRRVERLIALGASGRSLDIGCAGGYLVAEALRLGFDAHGLEISQHAVDVAQSVVPGRVRQGIPETAGDAPASWDLVTAFDVVEHHPDPRAFVTLVASLLKPGGFFAATVPDLSSLTGRVMGASWPHYKEEHRFYPTRDAFRALFRAAGLVTVHEEAARKSLSLDFVAPLFVAYPVPVLTPLASLAARITPRPLREARVGVTIGERFYVGRKPSS